MSAPYQPEIGTIRWKTHFRSSTELVYQALAQAEQRKKYWAESAEEDQGVIHYVFLNGVEDRGEILAAEPTKKYSVRYFGMQVTFELKSDTFGGTDLLMTATNVPSDHHMEISAGWVSWLMAMKAAVDFGVDLRNHDTKRTWFDGFADNYPNL